MCHSENKKKFFPPKCEDFIKRLDDESFFKNDRLSTVNINLLGGNVIILPGEIGQVACRIQWYHKTTAELSPKILMHQDVFNIISTSFNPFLGQKIDI
jgi:hypothetical protein